MKNNAVKKPLIILTGPTAAGKTNLSIQLAKAVGGEIISADSMQVYKHMDIGSAKITQQEMQGVPHHMIDILVPTEDFNVVIFQQYAKKYMEEIYDRGHIPILVGGTGFYIQSVLYDIDFTENDEDTAYRIGLEQEAETHGNLYLYEKLKAVDAKAAAQIHPNNIKRVIRALEFYEQTGTCISEHNEAERAKTAAYNARYFVLTDNRDTLYARIDNRVDNMLASGLVAEVQSLLSMGCERASTAMQGLGYKEIIDYLQGNISLERAVYLIKRDTRHFAKRQLTWFRREKEVIWLNKEEFSYNDDNILKYMLSELKKKQIL